MYIKRWKLQDQDPDNHGGTPPADPPAGPPPQDPPPSNPPADPPAAKWQDNWRETYAGEDKKKMERLGRYATPDAAFDALLSLQNKIGAGELRSNLPKDATPEQVNAWRAENGIPESPEKYEIKFGEGGLPESDKPVIDSFLKEMHGKNVNNDQAKATIDWYYKEVQRQADARAEQDVQFSKQSEDALRVEWGAEYRQNVNAVTALVDTAPADVKDLIAHGRLANGDPILSHPSAMKWFASLSRQINPITTVIPNAGANIGSAIDDEIADIEKLMRTDRKAYNENDKMQSRYRELLEARERLSSKK